MKSLFRNSIVCAGAASLVAIYLLASPSKVNAVSNTVMTGKCVAMSTTSSFMLANNTSENEISWIGILDFDKMTYSSIAAEVDRTSKAISRNVTEDRKFYLASDEIAGMYKMRFSEDPAKFDHIVLVPSNASNTIFMMDPILGATGVCQKL